MTDLHAESSTENPVADLCKLIGVSKQAYYQYDEDVALAKAAREEFANTARTFGKRTLASAE